MVFILSIFIWLIFMMAKNFYNAEDLKHYFRLRPVLMYSLALIAFIITIIVLWIFRKFIRNIKNGETFTEKNSSLLKMFSLGLIAVCLLTFLQKLSYYYYAVIPHGAKETNWSFNVWMLVLALIMWSFTHIFSVGQNLQKEKDLTI